MKSLHRVLLICLCLSCYLSYGQAVLPMYQYNRDSSTGINLAINRIESIYYPSNFPSMPPGTITSVYFRIPRRYLLPSDSAFYGLKVRMKTTDIKTYPILSGTQASNDTLLIKANEAIVASYPILNISTGPQFGDWIKIPLNIAAFSYSGTKNIVIQLTFDSIGSQVFIATNEAISTAPIYRSVNFYGGSDKGDGLPVLPMVGFDEAVTSVSTFKNLQSFGLFPNPSAGLFQLSFESAKAVNVVHISVLDANGKQVYVKSYSNVGTSFFKEANLEGVPKGIYYLKLEADEDVITRQVVMK